jgi:hypothetical protein
MHRFLYLAQRRPDLSLAEFQQRWRAHAQLAATCPDVLAEIRGYRQWQVIEPEADGVVGVAETRCVDAAAVYRMLECAGTRRVLQPDERRFLAVPCREAGLVADEVMLGTASDAVTAVKAVAFGCLWLAPRLPPASVATEAAVSAALAKRIGSLQALLPAATHDLDLQLSLGRRDAADEPGAFEALLFARCNEAALAKAVAAAWWLGALPGEKVFHLQRSARETTYSEMPR